MRAWIQVTFIRVVEKTEIERFNTAMSSLSEAVEWSYKDPKKLWTRNDFSRGLVVNQEPFNYLKFPLQSYFLLKNKLRGVAKSELILNAYLQI